jgi:hypothetical protein
MKQSRRIVIAVILATLALLICAAEDTNGWGIDGFLNVSQKKIMNDGNSNISVSYDINTDYPADNYSVIINNDGSVDKLNAFRSISNLSLTAEKNGRRSAHNINTFAVDRSWIPNKNYLAHIQFNSEGGTQLDAGFYERFEVEAFGYLTVYKFNDFNGNGYWDSDEPPLSKWEFNIIDPDGKEYHLVTDSNGKAVIQNGPVFVGEYKIAEQSKPNWIHTGTKIKKNGLDELNSNEFDGSIKTKVEDYAAIDIYFGNKLKNSTLSLNAFYDYDGNGIQKGILEKNISGLKFIITGGPKNSTYQAITDRFGRIALDLLTSDSGAKYKIKQVLPNDKWVCTTHPAEIEETLLLGINDSVIFGDRLTPASIGLTKFRDDNRNGDFDSNENGLEWFFLVNGTDRTFDRVKTNSLSGKADYSVRFTMPSPLSAIPVVSYSISEEPQNGWIMTTPMPQMPIILSPGERKEVPEFGNYLNQTIVILKFNDTNKNGEKDPGEEGIPDWQFLIVDGNKSSVTKKTDSQGLIRIKAEPNTKYSITEYLYPNWKPTTSIQRNLTTDLETREFGPLMFGNARMQWIHISKFEDIHNRGARDEDENGISGWEFDVTGPLDSNVNKTIRVTTDMDGNAIYNCLDPGRYIVKEIKRSGCWINTTDDTIILNVHAGQIVAVEFGNYQICHHPYANALQNQDVEVQKIVDPSQITNDMIGDCGSTYINYTIQITPKEKLMPIDLVLSVNENVSATENGQKTMDMVRKGVADFLVEQKTKSNPNSRMGMDVWGDTGSGKVHLNADYTNLSREVKNAKFALNGTTATSVARTLETIDEYFGDSNPNTKKILVLITDSESPINVPTEKIMTNCSVYAVAVGDKETETTRLLGLLTSKYNGKLYLANNSYEMRDNLTSIARVTRPAVLKNIELIDTLPSYLEPVDYILNTPNSTIENIDGRDWHTTTLIWNVGDRSSSERSWNTSFTARFCWIVPADIHEEAISARVSELNYIREDGSSGTIQVPEKSISIRKPIELVPMKIVPGFEVIFTLMGMLGCACMAMWRRKE